MSRRYILYESIKKKNRKIFWETFARGKVILLASGAGIAIGIRIPTDAPAVSCPILVLGPVWYIGETAPIGVP
jgi:hypothetical protein